MQTAEEENLALKDEIAKLKTQNSRFEDKIQFMKELLSLKEKNIELLKINLPKSNEEEKEIKKLKNQIFTLVSKLSEEEEKVQELQREIVNLKFKIDKVNEENLLLQQKVEQIEQKDKRIEQVCLFILF